MVVNGRKLADEILAGLKKEFLKLPPLSAGAVLVGSNPASVSFLKQKSKTAEKIGVNFKIFKFAANITTGKLLKEIAQLNKNKNINGIIVQLPLPKHIDTEKILGAINPEKDMDALSPKPSVFAPTVEAVKFVFRKYRVSLKNKNILVVGYGRLVGQPIYAWLSRSVSKIKIIDVKDENRLLALAKRADIIISGVGKADLIKGIMIKRDAVLVDFGFSRKNGKIRGDFAMPAGRQDFESCTEKAKLITPVPGGMGPIMVAMLFKNLFKLNKK